MSFIYVGRLDELKGIKVLFEAWRMLGKNGFKLKVCGTGPLENWCKKFIRQHGLLNIQMIGKVDNIEAKRLMLESEALILPSLWYEGFPMTIVEAYCVGIPVIGSSIGNIGCLIEDGVTGWKFETGNAEQLAMLIKNFKSIPRIQILDIYKELYLKNKNIEILEKIYLSVS